VSSSSCPRPPERGRRDGSVAEEQRGRAAARLARERNTNARERLALAAELIEALEHGGIEVYFQPEADADSGRS
jgi:hypothetical protein